MPYPDKTNIRVIIEQVVCSKYSSAIGSFNDSVGPWVATRRFQFIPRNPGEYHSRCGSLLLNAGVYFTVVIYKGEKDKWDYIDEQKKSLSDGGIFDRITNLQLEKF